MDWVVLQISQEGNGEIEKIKREEKKGPDEGKIAEDDRKNV